MPLDLVRDEWLSVALGRESYRVAVDTGLLDGSFRVQFDEFEAHQVFAYAKVPSERVAEVNILLAGGFALVETSITFGGLIVPPQGTDLAWDVRPAAPSDEQRVGEIASCSFRHSRFHADSAIPDATADKLKAAWARNYFSGERGDAMLVGLRGSEVAGFLLLLLVAEDELRVDLIAVDERFRGLGCSRALIVQSRDLFPGRTLRAATQTTNAASMRLYQSLGLKLEAATYVLHYHFPGGYST